MEFARITSIIMVASKRRNIPYIYIYICTKNINYRSQTIGRYLTNQGIMWPGMVMGLVAFVLNILFNWLFIYVFELGFIGSPIATSVSRIILPIFLWGFVVIKGYHKQTCFGFHKE